MLLCFIQTMCFHLGMTEAFIFDYDSTNARVTKPEETRQILKEIHHEFVKNDKALQYSHKVSDSCTALTR